MAHVRHPTLGGFHGSHEAGVVEWSSSALTRTDSSAVQSAVLLVVNRLCVGNGEVKANERAKSMAWGAGMVKLNMMIFGEM